MKKFFFCNEDISTLRDALEQRIRDALRCAKEMKGVDDRMSLTFSDIAAKCEKMLQRIDS